MIGINDDITQQKKTEIELKESEEKFRIAFMTSPDSINLNRLEDGVYLDINDGFTHILGYTREEVIGKTSLSLNIWKDPEDRKKLTEGLRKNGFVHNLEAQFVGKDGRIRHGLMSARKINLKNEAVILSITRDITERKEVENALKRSEKKWRNILINTPQIGISLNINAEITFANERFLTITGWEKHEVVGQNWFDMFIPENIREKVKNIFHSVVRQKTTLGFSTFENEIVGKSGEIYNIAWSNVLTKNTKGDVIDVTSLGVDLTERKRTENKLKKSEARYRIMMETIKDPIYICSEDYRIQYMNQAMRDRIGYDATGDLCYEALHGFGHKCPWCKYSDMLENGHTEKNIFSPKDNRSYSVSSSVFKNENGAMSKLSVFRDTTEFLNLQNRIQQVQKMEAIGNLAGGIAHDFNNILYPILGLSEMMIEDLPASSVSYEHAHEINNAGQRAKELVSQILSFSHQTEQERMPVKFQEVLKEVLKLCRSTIPTNIEIEQEIQHDCGSICANATQLHQIAMNLITNAYHAVQGKNGKITIGLKEVILKKNNLATLSVGPGKYTVLSVSDNGSGISEEIKSKIFEPYFTTKKKGKGTGLGLAVVYGIVKEIGGDTEVCSEAGSGTTFNIYLPLIKKTDDVEFRSLKPEIQAGYEHILLVDDEPSITRLVTLILERLGYTVTARVSSIEALEVFKKNPDKFAMIISDMSMPHMTGDQLAHKVRQIRPEMPIIICTGFSEQANKENAEEIGVNGFLMKPIVKSEMAKMIRKILDEVNVSNGS
ncbi:MAG: PAS domain S-box protein [Desulfobacterales bacterium]|nr:PAS domain S-box protein [Desulfobacterales bacterium]